jgi:TetR/AcrR family transcriptional regulator
MRIDGNIKQEHILEAAIKRFSYFGVNKTTMTEIAEDLAISKPSLFYYFQDKNSLIAAVVEKIMNEFLDEFKAAVEETSCVEQGLLTLVEMKRAYFKKYFLLALQGEAIDINKLPPVLPEIYQKGRKRNQELICGLFRKGIEQNMIAPIDAKRVSELFLETLAALEYCMRARKSIPEMTDIDEMFDKQREVVIMILNGLKSNNRNISGDTKAETNTKN